MITIGKEEYIEEKKNKDLEKGDSLCADMDNLIRVVIIECWGKTC